MLCALWALAALPAARALLGPAPDAAPDAPRLLRLAVSASAAPGPGPASLARRQHEVGLAAQRGGFFYSIEMQLGTPPQPVSVALDTGSDELWVNPVCDKSADAGFCRSFGRFNGSRTFVDAHFSGRVTYGTGYAALAYGYDFVALGSARISQQILGVATDSDFAVTGILGTGPSLNGWDSPYPRVIDSLARQGLTHSRAFSLDLRSIGSSRGAIIFGGIDTRKFAGRLERRPMIPAAASPDGLTRYWIYLDGLAVAAPNGSVVAVLDGPAQPQPVLLDSGYTVSTLPTALFRRLLAAFPEAEAPRPGSELYLVPCAVADAPGRLSFRFGATVIDVAFRDFIWHVPDGTCALGAIPNDNFPVLGDTFLRAAYVVFDWDNRNIHLARSEDCGSKLVAIGKGPDSVPSLAGECGAARPTNSSSSASASASASASRSMPTARGTAPVSPGHPTTTPMPASGGIGPGTTMPRLGTTSDWHNTTAPATYASTFTSTRTYTVTSCPMYVKGCAVGSVTTETVTGTTTWRPTQNAFQAVPSPSSITSVITTTRTHTVTDCHAKGLSCSRARVTTEVLTSTTYLCPESTATWTIPLTHTCTAGEHGCAPGHKVTATRVITVLPVPTGPEPTPVPGCTGCRMPPVAGTARAQTSSGVGFPSSQTSPAQTSTAQSSAAQVPLTHTSLGHSSLVQSPPVETAPTQAVLSSTVPGTISTVLEPTASPCTTCGPGTASTLPEVTGAATGAALWRVPGVAALALGALAVAAV